MRIETSGDRFMCPLSGTSHNYLIQASTRAVSLIWWGPFLPTTLSPIAERTVAYPCGGFLSCPVSDVWTHEQRPQWLVTCEPLLLPHCAVGILAMASVVSLELFCV